MRNILWHIPRLMSLGGHDTSVWFNFEMQYRVRISKKWISLNNFIIERCSFHVPTLTSTWWDLDVKLMNLATNEGGFFQINFQRLVSTKLIQLFVILFNKNSKTPLEEFCELFKYNFSAKDLIPKRAADAKTFIMVHKMMIVMVSL